MFIIKTKAEKLGVSTCTAWWQGFGSLSDHVDAYQRSKQQTRSFLWSLEIICIKVVLAVLVQPFGQKQCLIVTSSIASTLGSLERELIESSKLLEVTIKYCFWPIHVNRWIGAARTYRWSQGSTKSFRSVLWTFSKLRHDLRSMERFPNPNSPFPLFHLCTPDRDKNNIIMIK